MPDFKLESRRCRQCLLTFEPQDERGFCPHCARAFAFSTGEKNLLWRRQTDLFLNFRDDLGQGPADVLVLWSGGSDSTLTLYEAKYTLKLRVIALQFECLFERKGVLDASKEFLKQHRIPLITIKSDIRAMFRECHAGELEISEQAIADFPWDNFHASGDRSFVWKGAQILARKLNIRRVICGNNLIQFEPLTALNAPQSFGEQFISTHLSLLNPIRILLVYPDHLLLHLPMALGLTKEKKQQRLSEIGYQLPDYCYVTTESDTELGLLLSAISKKWYPTRTYIPYASAYGEFLSGYITREQWLEELVRVNTYSAEDLESAARRLRELIIQDQQSSDITLTINEEFSALFRDKEVKPMMNEVLVELVHNQRLLMTEQLIRMGKPGLAAAHARKAVELLPDEKDSYLFLGLALIKAERFEEALAVYGKGGQKFPTDHAFPVQKAVVYHRMKAPGKALALLNKLDANLPGAPPNIAKVIRALRKACTEMAP